jgi:hypothetical protein
MRRKSELIRENKSYQTLEETNLNLLKEIELLETSRSRSVKA